MKKITFWGIFVGLLFCLSLPTKAQLLVTGGLTAEEIVEALVGNGVQVSNVNINCPDVAFGTFDGTFSNIGMEGGILLTSGDINNAPGPNTSGSTTTVNGFPGDVDLDNLVGDTQDACILEFDFIPYSENLTFNYVFGSEEYEEFVGSSFNDVFAFFVSGPNPGGGTYDNFNIALIPGTSTPVSINNVNQDLNSEYYYGNGDGSDPDPDSTVQYDGFTVVLTAEADVIPCQVYHLKIAIADVGDTAYDSGVFLQEGSLSTDYVAIEAAAVSSTSANFDHTVEGCVGGIVTFSSENPVSEDFPITFSFGGTAVQGTDFTVPSNSTVIPAGQTSVSVPITVLEDGIAEGLEDIEIVFVLNYDCGTDSIVQTATLFIDDVTPLTISDDITVPPSTSVSLSVSGGSGEYTWSPGIGLSNVNSATPIATPLETTTYTATSQIGECTLSESVTITIQACDPATDPNAGIVSIDNNRICGGQSVNATASGVLLQSPEDVQVYVLHGSPIGDITNLPASLYGFNTSGVFANDGSAPYNVTLYITSIAGDDNGNGFPNLDDPCISVSPSVEVVFLQPTQLLANEYCDWNAPPNGLFYLTIYPQGGLPIYDNTATYTLSGDINATLSAGESFMVIFEGSTSTQSYFVSMLTDGNGCTADTSNTFICFKTPVELLSFEGQITETGNLLTWTTASETENDYFTLSRSIDNGQTFEKITTVDGAGNSISAKNYQYTDRYMASGTMYYTLSQTDINGLTKQVGTVVLNRASKATALQIDHISPVPTASVANITFNAVGNTANLLVFDVTGREVFRQNLNTQIGTNVASLNMSNYVAGTYFVLLNDGSTTVSGKLIKE